MTQSKSVKKKKKTKTDKSKNEEKKGVSTPASTPVDKRKIAEENLREMIKEAHKMHNNHTRSLKGLSAPTSRDTIVKSKEPEKPAVKRSKDGRYRTMEMPKRSSKTTKGGIEENMSSILMKMRRRLSEEILKKEGPSQKGSTESGKKRIEVVTGRCGSADFVTKKKEGIPRAGSAVFPAAFSKRRIDLAQRQGSAEFPIRKKAAERERGSSKKSRESLIKIRDYQVGSFVSLELLDKMTCNESDTCVRSRKSILRPSRHDTRKPSEMSDGHAKKSKKEKKKKEDAVSEKKSSSHKAASEKKGKVKKASPKRGMTDFESPPVKRESRVTSLTKSVISNAKSASSNLDSNISSATGAVDLFSSNTSRSYFSSESDISKIDKKFMQILEAVTQTKIGFEERAKKMAAEQAIGSNLPSTSKKDGEDAKAREPSELEQKLRERIIYLEQKLEKSKLKEEDMTEKKKKPEEEKVDIAAKPVVKQFCKEDKTNSPQPAADKKKDDVGSKAESTSTKSEGPSTREAPQLPKPTRKRQEPAAEAKPAKTSENIKGRDSDGSRQNTATKKHRKDDTKKTDKEVPKENMRETSAADRESEKNLYKKVGTWSILKRLEKAFQTLGLNLDDLDNSDEEKEDTSAKKKPRVMKYASSGQDKKVLPQSETLRRCQEAAQASISSTKSAHASGDTQFVAEPNGSGDKNTEYKRVRNSRKAEDLVRPFKEKKPKDKTEKEAYYASVKLTPRVEISEGYEDLPDGKHMDTAESKSSRKRCGTGEKQTTEHGIIPKKTKPNAEEPLSSKRYRKRPYTTNLDDGYIGRGKSKSDNSLSVSCSVSSLSEEEDKKCHKKKNHSLVREPYTRDEEVWTNKNGKGDSMSQTLMARGKKMDREVQSDWNLSSENVKKATNGVQTPINKSHKFLKMEEESEELELKQIRKRHQQIISEIKLSLEEIKKQHNLCTRLRKQTKQFNRDCHAKRRMLASYLRDVETNYERRNRRHPSRDIPSWHSRALSTDRYHYNMQKTRKLRKKLSDCDMLMVRHRNYGRYGMVKDALQMDEVAFSVIETDNETSSMSEVVSSIMLTHTSTELALTDTAEESYRSITSSLHTVCRKYRPKRDTPPGEGITSMEMRCLQWEGDDKLNISQDGVRQAPSYFAQLLQKLNRIITKEKTQLEDLVVKASTSSNRSTQSNKTKPSLSAISSGSSLHREQHHKSSGVARPATTDNEICSSNFGGSGSARQYKSKGSKKNGQEKSPDNEEGMPISRSRSFIRGDPGGRSFDSLVDQERDATISESFGHRADASHCGTSCIHLEKHAEEHRYRKGDPSFRSPAHILQKLGEHSRHCMDKIQEDNDAWKRKLEIERILRVNEKLCKRTTTFGRDTDTHALDYDPYIIAKGRQIPHARHRQQSIIIDHNRGEENEESQTVLGHASRHSGVALGLRKHGRKAPHEYLKSNRKSESSHTGRHHDKKGKRHHSEQVPINYCEISVNTPGSSSSRLRDAYCQTESIDDYDDIGDIYLLDESGSSPSFN